MKLNFCNKEYMSKLFKFSHEVEGTEMRFKDKVIDQNYFKSNIEEERKKAKIFCCYSLLLYFLIIIVNLVYNDYSPNRSMYTFIGGLILDLAVYKISDKCITNFNLQSYSKYLRFFSLYLIIAGVNLFPVNLADPETCTVSRGLLGLILCFNLIYLYYLDFNAVIMIIIAILNCILIIFCQFKFGFPPFYLSFEFIGNILYYIPTFFFKRYELYNKKKIFFESFKNEQYIDYISQLINVLNTMVISVKNKEVLFINNYAISYFVKKSNIEVKEEIQENNILLSHNSNNNEEQSIHDYMNSFFGSLILENPYENQTLKFNKGKLLNEVISKISSSEIEDSKEFSKIGYFKSLNDHNFFEVFIRKLKLKEEVVELLINDITEIKLAEKTNTETKYKQKILAKIAHEFKTPLITIISLIQKTMTQQGEILLSIRNNLNHINNLSNYTLVLISDIIHYVSDSIKLVLNKNEIIVNEVLEFSLNVLKTLVECNEHKVNKIKTEIEIDENVNKMMIFTDENRLKQILLNLISNAFKFTSSGFIKIKATYLLAKHSIEITVEDTGLGIKNEDHHLIFHDNVQLNIDKEYNFKGSGLGLSIAKTIADSLDHEIGFSSNLGVGSKFYLRMKCIHKKNQEKIFKSKSRTASQHNSLNIFSSIPLGDSAIDIELKNKSINFKDVPKNVDFFQNFQQNISTPIRNFTLIIDEDIQLNSLTNSEKNQLEIISTGFTISSSNSTDNDYKFSIVVVDDHKFIRESNVNLIKNVMTTLNMIDFKIIEGCDGIDLLNLVRLDKDYKIKYIFTDENMMYLNGSEAVRQIRKFEQDKKIQNYKIFSITAFDDEETKKNILDSGINSILSKPCSKSELLKIFK